MAKYADIVLCLVGFSPSDKVRVRDSHTLHC